MQDFTTNLEEALIVTGALIALVTMLALIIGVLTRGARARASEKARAWTELKRPDWEARAARKREERASGARADARLRGALMIAVAVVAIAATNLSAHATIDAMRRVGLLSIDTAISAVIVFEMFLAILGALSWWHMRKGTGFNRYELGVWAMASLMGGIAWWGGGSPIFALWPLLAAVAWHVVITFGRDHKTSGLVRWWRMKRGQATSQDATAIDTERRISRIVHCAYMANEGLRASRALYERAFNRAWARADELGILTPEVRARIQTRLAARYAGARALAPESVAHMNPWNERASQSARTARTVRPVSAPPAPALEVSAHEDTDARASVAEAAPVDASPAHGTSALVSAVLSAFTGPDDIREWVVKFVRTNGKLPTRNDLAVPAQKSPGHVARWMGPVRKELGLS